MRDYISAKYLLAAPPPSVTVIPADFKITRCAARQASGIKPRTIKPRPEHGTQPRMAMGSKPMGDAYHGAKVRLHNASR